MRLIYADPGLLGIGGHHMTACENIINKARARGFEPRVFASARMAPYLREKLGATPLFRADPTKVTDDDPFCGFMNSCFADSASLIEDLENIPDVTAEDLIYMPSAQGAQLLGLGQWLGRRASRGVPTAVIDLNFQPGLEPVEENGKRFWEMRNPLVDPRAAIYRYAARSLAAIPLPTLHIFTGCPDWVDVYGELLMRKVHLHPTLPFEGPKTLFKRGARKRLTIVTLGHQWEQKGFHLVPGIFASLLERPESLRLVAHNSNAKADATAEARALTAMAAAHEHVIYDNRILSGETYQELLDAADILLCPYNPDHYRTTLSAVVTEAVANGIPVVVPGGTALAADAAAYGVGVTFDSFDAPAVAAAVAHVLDDYDAHATKALAAAERWNREKGVGRFFDEILRIARGGAS